MAPLSLVPDKKKLDDLPYYHGYITDDMPKRLVHEPGQFMVWAREDGLRTTYLITVCDEERKVVELPLKQVNKSWSLLTENSTQFPSIASLVDHYEKHPITENTNLTKMVPRREWRLKHDQVVCEDLIGRGHFCSFHKGKLILNGETKKVAVKVGTYPEFDNSDGAKEARKAILNEALLLSFYRHDNIVQFMGSACYQLPAMIVMELCMGTLQSHLLTRGYEIDSREKFLYAYEVSRGIFYLHKQKCVHRDIRSAHCLISSSGTIKLTGFGLAMLIDDTEESTTATKWPTPIRFAAPEVLRLSPLYSKQSDIWAFGVLLYEIYSNGMQPSWEDERNIGKQIRRAIMPSFPLSTPKSITYLAGTIWKVDLTQRPSMRVVAKYLNTTIREANCTEGVFPANKMTINKIHGVSRTVYFEHDETSEFEESSTGMTMDI